MARGPWRLTVRDGPRVSRSRHPTAAAAVAAAREALEAVPVTRRPARAFTREVAPVAQVPARAHLRTPSGARIGVDRRGDGSVEAWRGTVHRSLVAPEPDEDAWATLLRIAS